MSLKDTLRGTGVALVTPFDEKSNIDFNAYHKLIEFVLHGGVEYLVVLGSTGEAATISEQEKLDLINFTYSIVPTTIPIVIGIASNNTKDVVRDIQNYPLDKATAVLCTSPWYNKPTQEGIFQHYKSVAEASSKPVILYNVPSRTGSNITADTTVRIAHEIDNVAGIKEASGNMVQCLQIIKNKPSEFLVTSGDDHLAMPLIAAGMDGVISVAANCFPKDFSEMVRMTLRNENVQARGLMYKMLTGFDLLFEENNPAGVKAFLTEAGIIKNNLRLPLLPLSSGVHNKIKTFLELYTA